MPAVCAQQLRSTAAKVAAVGTNVFARVCGSFLWIVCLFAIVSVELDWMP